MGTPISASEYSKNESEWTINVQNPSLGTTVSHNDFTGQLSSSYPYLGIPKTLWTSIMQQLVVTGFTSGTTKNGFSILQHAGNCSSISKAMNTLDFYFSTISLSIKSNEYLLDDFDNDMCRCLLVESN